MPLIVVESHNDIIQATSRLTENGVRWHWVINVQSLSSGGVDGWLDDACLLVPDEPAVTALGVETCAQAN